MKIWINAPFSGENLEIIRQSVGDSEIYTGNKVIPDAEIIVGYIPEGYNSQQLRLLQSVNAGVEKLLDSVPENVIITNVTGAFGEVISEYVVSGILALDRGLFGYRENQKGHIWKPLEGGVLLSGRNALVLGCGDIGSHTALKLRAFGVHTVGIRRNPIPAEGFDEVYGSEKLDNILTAADIVICCLPYTSQTHGMLSAKRFENMKNGALLVNVGRGAVVDNEAMISALQNGKLRGAVLDVFDKEPLADNSPLWDMENVLITPHISGPSFGHFPEVERKIAEICAGNLSAFTSGKPLRNVINRTYGYAERGEIPCRK